MYLRGERDLYLNSTLVKIQVYVKICCNVISICNVTYSETEVTMAFVDFKRRYISKEPRIMSKFN